MIKMNLTVENYRLLREKALDKGHDIYPSYDSIDQMKKICAPEAITFLDDEAVVSIEAVLDHRIERILKLNPEIVDEMHRIQKLDENVIFTFFYKYGTGRYIFNSNCWIFMYSDTNLSCPYKMELAN